MFKSPTLSGSHVTFSWHTIVMVLFDIHFHVTFFHSRVKGLGLHLILPLCAQYLVQNLVLIYLAVDLWFILYLNLEFTFTKVFSSGGSFFTYFHLIGQNSLYSFFLPKSRRNILNVMVTYWAHISYLIPHSIVFLSHVLSLVATVSIELSLGHSMSGTGLWVAHTSHTDLWLLWGLFFLQLDLYPSFKGLRKMMKSCLILKITVYTNRIIIFIFWPTFFHKQVK